MEKFFDRVNHDVLMGYIERQIEDKRVLAPTRRYLEAGTMSGGLVGRRQEGTPQGGPLSPLLSNILLNELDHELERRGHRFVRYADDANIYVRSQRAGARVMAGCDINFAVSSGANGSSPLRGPALMRLGLNEARACNSAFNGRGPWWSSAASHMNQALPKKLWDRLGLVSILDTITRLNRLT